VSKKWKSATKTTWKKKSSVFLDMHTIFGHDRLITKDTFFNITRTIFTKKLSLGNLTTIDLFNMPTLPSWKHKILLRLISTVCGKLTHLSLFTLNDSSVTRRNAFVEFIESEVATGLRGLELCGSLFTDELMELVFDRCRKLERLFLDSADHLTGFCFARCSGTLKRVFLKDCCNFLSEHFLTMVRKCRDLTELKIAIFNFRNFNTSFLSTLLFCVPKIERLIIELNEDCREASRKYGYFLSRLVLVSTLKHLRDLVLDAAFLDNDQLGTILSQCMKLAKIQILYVQEVGLTSAAFTTTPIRAPLEMIVIESHTGLVDDAALDAFKQCSATLKLLNLTCNQVVSSKCIIELLESCPRLEILELNDTNCDESVLDKVLDMAPDGRCVDVFCSRTKVDMFRFLSGKEASGYSKRLLNNSFYEVRMNNLCFFTNALVAGESEDELVIMIFF
jgi:hypothetical protein